MGVSLYVSEGGVSISGVNWLVSELLTALGGRAGSDLSSTTGVVPFELDGVDFFPFFRRRAMSDS